MEILLWLLPAAVTTGVAMAVVGWLGRERPADDAAGDLHATSSHLEVHAHPGEGVSPARPARVPADVREERPRSAAAAPSRRSA